MRARNATLPQFRRRATIAIDDIRLQSALKYAADRYVDHRLQAWADFPDLEALRDHFKSIRAATMAELAHHLERFESNAQAAGAQVHWAGDAAEACRIVTGIARQHGVDLITKSKSMSTEEIWLNESLTAAGITPVETDLGEWILQLAGEPPFHIIGPAMHKTQAQVAELFSQEIGEALPPDDVPRLTAVARRLLREKFLAAGMGVTGANIGVAETGSIVLVTNEGNAEMVTSLPPVHAVVMGIEKIARNWDDAAAWLSLLARSATGQSLSVYTTVITGPARPTDPDGPQEVHIILLDNGRSQLVGGPYEEVLQCIRCGACLSVCPVYRAAGGQAYGNPYSGPIGAVIGPLLFGLDHYGALPQASSLCGACLEACPVRIDLPGMLVALREEEVEKKLIPWPERAAEQLAGRILAHERLMVWASRLLRLLQRPFIRHGRLRVPRRLDPMGSRRLPALAQRSFRDMWEKDLKNQGRGNQL